MKQRPWRILYIILCLMAFGALVSLIIVYWQQLKLIISLIPHIPSFMLKWDILLFILIASIHIVANVEATKSGEDITLNSIKPEEDTAFNKRKFFVDVHYYASTALKDASTAYISAVSILIPASFVIVQVSKPTPPAKPPAGVDLAIPYVFRAVVWFLVSLLSGIAVLYLVSMYGRLRDLTRSLMIGIIFGFQFITLIIGVLCLITGLYFVVFANM
jgi:hypothetical protein